MRPRIPSSCILSVVVLLACGRGTTDTGDTGGSNEPAAPSTVAVFTVNPVNMPDDATFTPLGHIQPVGHVLPTDHVYFYANNWDHPRPDTVTRVVYAPGEGVVAWMVFIQAGISDWKVVFRMTNTFYYYVDHVQIDPSIKVGARVHAGDRIGTTSPGGTVDLGAYDMAQTLTGFVTPSRYPDQTLHCVSPWKYFNEPLRSQNYARIRRVPSAPDRDGKIDYDVPGRLVGSWFHESLPKDVTSSGPNGWPKSLAFAYDFNDPSIVRISIGGTIATPSMWRIPGDAPRPENVSTANGKVSYRLMTLEGNQQGGLMLVEMTAPDRIRVEVFEGSQAATAEFDSRAQVYVR
ncbi:MAG: hypothetical protein U0163_10115 [Gemmatimonadaceae bacterium]